MREPCDIVQDLLPLYLDGALRQQTKLYVDRHLAECAKCRADKDEMENLAKWQVHQSFRQQPPPLSPEEAQFIRKVKTWRRRSGMFFLMLILLCSAAAWMLRTYVDKPVPAVNPVQSIRKEVCAEPLL
ncbi:MAG: zf-HC2 domain-containing protein [Brevibacillus sp.]|nr:zf-HC2 domain-containing protein [Brevibacillus sp.]